MKFALSTPPPSRITLHHLPSPIVEVTTDARSFTESTRWIVWALRHHSLQNLEETNQKSNARSRRKNPDDEEKCFRFTPNAAKRRFLKNKNISQVRTRFLRQMRSFSVLHSRAPRPTFLLLATGRTRINLWCSCTDWIILSDVKRQRCLLAWSVRWLRETTKWLCLALAWEQDDPSVRSWMIFEFTISRGLASNDAGASSEDHFETRQITGTKSKLYKSDHLVTATSKRHEKGNFVLEQHSSGNRDSVLVSHSFLSFLIPVWPSQQQFHWPLINKVSEELGIVEPFQVKRWYRQNQWNVTLIESQVSSLVPPLQQ